MPLDKKEIPKLVRTCYQQAKRANRENREAEIERLRFWAGGDLQWRDEEITRRRNQGRPWITINKCTPAVNQIEGDIRLNPPGPQVHPVGGGADGDVADIIEGLIREVEYRSDARTAYSTAGKYSAASGYGVIELCTEFVSDRSFQQRLRIDSVEDPSTVFFDPNARAANRQDAMWAGKLKMYSKEDYRAAFGKRKILEPAAMQQAMGWIADALGINGKLADLYEWTGAGEGPFYVCEFYMVEIKPTKLRLYTDHITRFDDEKVPRGVKSMDGEENVRSVGRRAIKKYVVDALEVLDETEWLGSIIPLIPVLGPEVYINGKLHRLSLIAGAIDSQRALNYVATTSTELAGMMPKSPWIGWEGQFDDPRWQTANSEMYAYLEIKPVHATDENGQQTLLPAPQRNLWEAPIQWLLALAAYFSDSIKATTAIYDPSLGAQKGDQSGKAIEQLRSESNVGNFSYSDNLHRAIAQIYKEMVLIFPLIMDGPRVVTIVKPDSQHEIVEINKDFDGSGKASKNITFGEYSARVTVNTNFDTRQKEAIAALTEFFKVAPQALGAPGVAAQFLRLIGDGNPKIEGMADLMGPTGNNQEATPAQLQGQLQQATQQNQQLTQMVQQLHQAIQSKLPELESKKWIAMLDAATKIRAAEITASKDADRLAGENEASLLEHMTGLAHDAATQAADHEHKQSQLQAQQAHATQTQASDQQAASQQQEAAQQAQGANQ